MKKNKMKILASDVDAVRAVKEVFPILEAHLRRIDLCLFDHAWLNVNWEKGDTAGTLFFTCPTKFKMIENIVFLALTQTYQDSKRLQHTYQFKARNTGNGFAVDIDIDPEVNPAYKFDVDSGKANADNITLLKNKLGTIGGIFRPKVVGAEILFSFNNQGFKIIRDKKASALSNESKPIRKIKCG
jgi:hypothetical protein